MYVSKLVTPTLTCILVKLYSIAPQSRTYSIWILRPHWDRYDLDRLIKSNATLWFWLLGKSRGWWRFRVRTSSCSQQVHASLQAFLFFTMIVLELRCISWNALKISCRQFPMKQGWFRWSICQRRMLASQRVAVVYNTQSHQKFAFQRISHYLLRMMWGGRRTHCFRWHSSAVISVISHSSKIIY